MLKNKRQAILVLGMHRSGTSALTGALGLLGARLPAKQLPPQLDNPKGFFESQSISEIHDRLLKAAGTSWFNIDRIPDEWFRSAEAAPFIDELTSAVQQEFGDAALFVVKDPRMCRLIPLWREVLSRIDVEARFAITLRNPFEVADSLETRNGFPVAYGCLLWLQHMIEAEHLTRGPQRVFKQYDDLLHEPVFTAEDVFRQLKIQLSASNDVRSDALGSFIDPALRHHTVKPNEPHTFEALEALLSEAYGALNNLTRNPTDYEAQRRLDGIRTAFDRIIVSLTDLFAIFEATSSNANGQRDPGFAAVAERKARAVALQITLAARDAEIARLKTAVAVYAAEIRSLEETRSKIYASTSWRLTKPLRFLKRLLGQLRLQTTGFGSRKSPAIKKFSQALHEAFRQTAQKHAQLGSTKKFISVGLKYLKTNGLRATIARLSGKAPWTTPASSDGRSIIETRYAAFAEDARERFFGPPRASERVAGPTISILMPVYKTPLPFLDAAIKSVLNQNCPNWELCIVDDCSQSDAIENLLGSFARNEPRIKVKVLESNQGISAATNAALAMATGDFVALLDHDDLLTYDAIHQVGLVLDANPETDFIYSDECKIGENDRVEDIFSKPDWDEILLLNFMYTGHFSVYRRSLVVELGGLRSEFDFSQDYDLALRVAEKTNRTHHIERILYGWRKAEGSAAAGDKDFARQSNIAALRSALERRNCGGNAVALPTGNKPLFDRSRDSALVSIIVPSDNELHIRQSVASIVENSSYPNFEIIVVTRTETAASLQDNVDSRVRFTAYDDTFNFSAKCNAGARDSIAEFLVFFNDDVRVGSPDWLECMIDYLARDGVGGVAPKLLYENGSIQHAGIVTGVRRLVGTAFHCLPSDTTVYFNLAQSVRNVSVLSAACLAVRRELFELIGGFDTELFPIANSDVDLCFKIRRAGFACIYTPFAKLKHIGHASLISIDSTGPLQKDKADINLLRNWGCETARDPFWTRSMRNLLYADSPEIFDIFSPTQPATAASGKDILLVFHELSNSGAPRGIFEMAQHLIAGGHFVVAISPSDGFFREELQKIGVTVIIDELVLKSHPSVADFARNFDLAIVNTVVSWPFVLQNAARLDCYWYLHESHAIRSYANELPPFREALRSAKAIWVTGLYAKSLSEDLRPDIAVLEYGIDPAAPQNVNGRAGPADERNRIKIGVFGSYETRKGQDLAIAAIHLLPAIISKKIELNFFGRVLDQGYLDEIKRRALGNFEINFGPELPQAACTQELLRCDLILIPSRDEALSLVGLDAISAGKVVVCSTAVGLSNYLRSGESAFIAKSSAPEDLASAMVEAILAKAEWQNIGVNAQNAFNRVFTKSAFRDRLFRALS